MTGAPGHGGVGAGHGGHGGNGGHGAQGGHGGHGSNGRGDDGSGDDDGSPALPAPELFAAVVGQAAAVEQLRWAARRPVHAYLLVGPPGSGAPVLARAFAAALLCPDGGCGTCNVCRRTLAGSHPDLTEIERSGAALSVGDAGRVVRLAQRRPLEGARQVIVIGDVHLARVAAPVLLKTLEEPPGPTVFVLLSESVPAELATIASRCVRVDLGPVPAGELATWLRAQGVDADVAGELAEAAAGSVDRARMLTDDPDFALRRSLWRRVPERLDGTGAAAAAVVAELLATTERSVEALHAAHQAELEALAAAAEAVGERGVSGRREIEERHRREERRWRTDEVRAGLAVLVGAYRDRLLAESTPAAGLPLAGLAPSGRSEERIRALFGAVASIETAAAELVRNPNEALLLEALLVRLSAVPG